MSNIFVLHSINYKRYFKKYVALTIHIYQYIAFNIIFLNSILCIPPKIKMPMFGFPSLIFK